MKLLKFTPAGFKKTLLALSTLACVFCLITVKAQCPTPVFYEGFESGSIAPTWTALNTFSTFAVTVNTVLPNSGAFKLHMTGVSSHLQGIVANFTAATPTTVSWSIYPYHITGGSNYFVLGDATVSYSHCLVFCCWIGSTATTGNIRFYSSNTTYIDYPTNNQQWHKIELKNINYTAMTFDIWINNSLFASSYPFRSSSLNNVSRLHLYNLTAVGSSAWDDIMIGEGLVGSVSTSPPSCFAGNNGTATATAMGGLSPYTYSWSTSGTGSVVTNLQGNTNYSLFITDANNCIYTKTFSLIPPAPLSSTIITQSVTCFGYSNGQATVNTTGGITPYTYSWTNNSIGPSTNSLSVGSHTVSISDAKGCLSSSVITIAGPQFSVSATNTVSHVSCFGGANGSVVTQGTGGTGVFTYSWSPPANPSPVRTNLPAGNYTLYVSDQNLCTYSNVINVKQPVSLTTQFTTSTITCLMPGGASLNTTGGTPPYNYTWQPTGGNGANLVTTTPGKHTVTVTDNQGCTKTFSLAVNANLSNPTITLNSSKSMVCAGETVNIYVVGNGDNFLWFDGSSNTVIALSPTVSTNYSVTSTFASNGCTTSASFFQKVSNCNTIDEFFLQNNSIYPNPVTDILQIKSNLINKYQIITPEGRIMGEGDLNVGENKINLERLPAGIYFIVFSSDAKPSSKRFIKL